MNLNSQQTFIKASSKILKILFCIHLIFLIVIMLFNYFDPLGYLHGVEPKFTIRGEVKVMEKSWLPLHGEYQILKKDSVGLSTIFLMKKSGFARIDFTDFHKAFKLNPMVITILDIAYWWLWLIITYQLMKIISSLKSNNIFDPKNITRLRIIAFIFGTAPFIGSIKNLLFSKLLDTTIQIPHHGIYFPRDFKYIPGLLNYNALSGVFTMFIILLLIEIFRYGLSIKQENDLTI